MVKNPPAMQETWVRFPGWDEPQKKGMVTHFIILAWRIPWTEEPSGLQSMGPQRVGYNWATNSYEREPKVWPVLSASTTRVRVTRYLFNHGQWPSQSQHTVLCNMITPSPPGMLFSDPWMITGDKRMSSSGTMEPSTWCRGSSWQSKAYDQRNVAFSTAYWILTQLNAGEPKMAAEQSPNLSLVEVPMTLGQNFPKFVLYFSTF